MGKPILPTPGEVEAGLREIAQGRHVSSTTDLPRLVGGRADAAIGETQPAWNMFRTQSYQRLDDKRLNELLFSLFKQYSSMIQTQAGRDFSSNELKAVLLEKGIFPIAEAFAHDAMAQAEDGFREIYGSQPGIESKWRTRSDQIYAAMLHGIYIFLGKTLGELSSADGKLKTGEELTETLADFDQLRKGVTKIVGTTMASFLKDAGHKGFDGEGEEFFAAISGASVESIGRVTSGFFRSPNLTVTLDDSSKEQVDFVNITLGEALTGPGPDELLDAAGVSKDEYFRAEFLEMIEKNSGVNEAPDMRADHFLRVFIGSAHAAWGSVQGLRAAAGLLKANEDSGADRIDFDSEWEKSHANAAKNPSMGSLEATVTRHAVKGYKEARKNGLQPAHARSAGWLRAVLEISKDYGQLDAVEGAFSQSQPKATLEPVEA